MNSNKISDAGCQTQKANLDTRTECCRLKYNFWKSITQQQQHYGIIIIKQNSGGCYLHY